MTSWSGAAAINKLIPAMRVTGLQICEYKLKIHPDTKHALVYYKSDGILLTQHKKSWKKKREDQYLIRFEYIWEGKTVFAHTEPWIGFPSDLLVSKMMLLPVEVKK